MLPLSPRQSGSPLQSGATIHAAFTLRLRARPLGKHSRGHLCVHFRYGPMAHCHPKDDLVDRLQRFSFLPPCYPSRVGGGALARWPPSAAQTARTVLAYAAFTKPHRWCDAREGINPTKLTSPYWLYSAAHGSCFQPLLRQRLHRCDQIRRTIQQSSRWKSFRT